MDKSELESLKRRQESRKNKVDLIGAILDCQKYHHLGADDALLAAMRAPDWKDDFPRHHAAEDIRDLLTYVDKLENRVKDLECKISGAKYTEERMQKAIDGLMANTRLHAAEAVCTALWESPLIPKAIVGGFGMQDPIEWADTPEEVQEDVIEGLFHWNNVKNEFYEGGPRQ